MTPSDPAAVDPTRFGELHSGFSSSVLRDGDLCLRVPRSAAAAARHDAEEELLDAVAGRLPVEVATTSRRLGPTAEFPHGARLTRWLDGEEVDASVDPASLRDFVRRLHGIDLSRLPARVPAFGDWCRRQRALERAGLEALDGRLEPRLHEELRQGLAHLGDGIETSARPCLIHGDLWYGNLLMRENRLTGVLDWEYAAIGDPLADIADLWYLGDAFMASLLGSLDGLPKEVGYYRLVREFHGLVWSLEHRDEEEEAESLQKVIGVAKVVLT